MGELLVLEHEPDNPHDINAIRVLRETGEQIGYRPRDFAGEVVPRAAKGAAFYAAIAGIGRAGGRGPCGVALLIVATTGMPTARWSPSIRLGCSVTVCVLTPSPINAASTWRIAPRSGSGSWWRSPSRWPPWSCRDRS